MNVHGCTGWIALLLVACAAFAPAAYAQSSVPAELRLRPMPVTVQPAPLQPAYSQPAAPSPRAVLLSDSLLLASADAPPRSGRSDDERRVRPWRLWGGVAGYAAINVPVMYGLTQLWYDESVRTSFHWYSDGGASDEPGEPQDGWLDDWHTYVQQDKLGHAWTAWHLARAAGSYGRWAGLSDGKAGFFGAAVATVFQAQIEIYDGFDRTYGASRTDLLANTVGAAVGGLKVAYPEQLDFFEAKYSYHVSPYHDESIGPNGALRYAGNAIRDYDGMSFWMVVRPNELLRGTAKERWPDWLGLAVGYSADNIMHEVSGLRDPRFQDDPRADEHQRVLLLGPDLDLLHWAAEKAPEPWASVASALSFIRLPAPALQVTPDLQWHWVFN